MIGKSRSDGLRVVLPQDDGRTAGSSIAMPDRRSLAIDIRGATLQYPVGAVARGSLKSALFSVFGHREPQPKAQYVNAMTDLDLSIAFGERIGIVGSNGSGKSTLLRAIAGVYPLAKGSITVVGQVGTLLDIGLGFEAESTGRENIYYRGMAMGYSRKEIAAAESEIVDFAGLGDFIDLPMRTYSSGMFIRLGFGVSTQFQPDVLLIDEVFGAGDVSFAQKALARIKRVVDAAGIVVLASHDLGLIQTACTRVLWLDGGRVRRDGPPSVVVPQYHEFMAGQG